MIPYFNPRIPCGMRQDYSFKAIDAMKISIHASHAGCDTTMTKLEKEIEKFQSTHPMRDATITEQNQRLPEKDFNPRIPCGMRQYSRHIFSQPIGFQSTHPMRDATQAVFDLVFY